MQVVVQAEPLGQGDAILTALRGAPGRADRPLLITQVHDLLSDDLLTRIVAAYQADPQRSYLAAYRARDYFPGGYFQMAGERAIRHGGEAGGRQCAKRPREHRHPAAP